MSSEGQCHLKVKASLITKKILLIEALCVNIYGQKYMPRFNQIINKECSRGYMFATYFDSVYTKVLICKT